MKYRIVECDGLFHAEMKRYILWPFWSIWQEVTDCEGYGRTSANFDEIQTYLVNHIMYKNYKSPDPHVMANYIEINGQLIKIRDQF